jgi:hypothetical protein
MGDDQLREIMSNVSGIASQRMSNILGQATKLAVGDVEQLGVFDETPDSICSALLLRGSSSIGGSLQDNVVSIVALAYVRINNRVILLYATSIYEDAKDIAWTRLAMKQWRDGIIAANHIQPVNTTPNTSP